jgi:pullulanase
VQTAKALWITRDTIAWMGAPLFRLQTEEEVKERAKLHNSVVMVIDDTKGRTLDPKSKSLVVLFNADKTQKTIDLSHYCRVPLELHPGLRHFRADLVVRQARYDDGVGRFVIPPRTTAVFVERW